MAILKWFDRQFELNKGIDEFPALLKRLQNMPATFKSLLQSIDEAILIDKPDNKWSIKEQVGHLFIMEPLWRRRLKEIKNNETEMSPADLNNTATNEAGFNQYTITDILEKFAQERKATIVFLEKAQPEDFKNSLFHPRLQQPMHITDLMYFVAEHDTHHLNVVKEIFNGRK